ncbi:uncharacterized protein LOC105689562 [Athalia rosae]|uniref:uncharacterized protein LOC105689562 n=1 Tax=Athalia rosae TaxID=37344 RepID=UPI00203437B1|nr:uncharacterized protein LOC105689562 [Athalia rosae]
MSGSEGGIIYFAYENEDGDDGATTIPEVPADQSETLGDTNLKPDEPDREDVREDVTENITENVTESVTEHIIETITEDITENATDHDYIELIQGKEMEQLPNMEEGTIIIIQDNGDIEDEGSHVSVSNSVELPPIKEHSFSQITNLSQLKKVTPRVKLQSPEKHLVKGLAELRNINFPIRNKHSLNQAKQQLKKYCRTCAGLKLPLVDIFSDKGIQMRLNQQMKHLEEINQHGSLSTQMCMDCICDLKMSYKFFMQIKKAEFKLKSIYNSLSEKSENDCTSKNLSPGEVSPNIAWNDPTVKIEKDVHTYANKKTSFVNAKKTGQLPKTLSFHLSTEISDSVKSPLIKPKEEPLAISDAECTTDMFEDVTDLNHNDDNDSIEEFDPEDLPFHPDTSEYGESNDELEELGVQKAKKARMMPMNEQQELSSTAAVYHYDNTKKAYVKYEVGESKENLPIDVKDVVKSEAVDGGTDPKKQPNILKRRLSLPLKSKTVVDSLETSHSADSNIPTSPGKTLQKLSMNHPISIGTKGEDGIMYVTVKGSKPNELLLVKVKKMDKPGEKVEEVNLAHAAIDMKPVDRMLKKYEALKMKEKNLFSDKYKKPDIREQIIEEQIEEYKRRREQVLGGNMIGLTSAMNNEDGSSKFIKTENNSGYHRRYTPHKTRDNDVLKIKEEPESLEIVHEIRIKEECTEIFEKPTDHKSSKQKQDTKSDEYLARMAHLKEKWEEAKSQKESLLMELEEEGNQEKLERILGEREDVDLEEFQEYLKQRNIAISRLKDQDIISLYEDRNNAHIGDHLLEGSEDVSTIHAIPLEDYLECDYCPETFPTDVMLEDHLKKHDYRIMHYCEDCLTEFPTNKAKKNHNITCMQKMICKYCDLMLDSKGKKRQHEQKHCDNMYGQLCDTCGEKFKHQGTLDQHIKTQHMSWEKVFQCPKCPKKFAFKQKLTFHLKSVHTTLRAYLCEDCGADFKNPASLRHHRIRKHQPVGNKRECSVCHKMVPFYSLSKHMHTHKAYTIQCPHCDKMFKNSSTLKQHVRIHEDQRQYRCDICGVGFNRRDGLRLHMRVHEKTDSRGLKECSCQVCGEKFPNHSMLVIHRNRVHKDGRQYTCHICNRSMISPRSLEWHMSHIHNQALPGEMQADSEVPQVKKRVTCYHCDKTFKTEMILRTHIKNTHVEKDPMKCAECDQLFTSDVRLRHHMMVIHNRLEGTLPCPHCPKRFVNQLRLKTHMISHSEERPYTCEVCGFNLKTKIQLIKHHQNRHSDERPLQCKYCPWRCKQVSALVCHERTHTNERPYACSVCRQRFKYLGDKNKHERRHESLGGSGFKRIVTGRNTKQPRIQTEMLTSGSEHDQEEYGQIQVQYQNEGQYEEQTEDQYEDDQQVTKFEPQEIEAEYEQSYDQDYETSREASEAAEVIMSMEDTTVYTEEVTADDMESTEIITDEITNQIFQTGTVVHLEQQDDSGKIQVFPVMLSLPDLTDANSEVNLATASIMYNT